MVEIAGVVAAFEAAWTIAESATATSDAVLSHRERLRDRAFRRRVVRRTREALAKKDTIQSRAARRVLQDAAFLEFAVDPQDPKRRAALDPQLLADLVGSGTDVEAVIRLLADAWVSTALGAAAPLDRLILDRVGALERLITAGPPAHEEQWRVLMDGAPFLAQDVRLQRFRMASDVTGDEVPPYVLRDTDIQLDDQLGAALAGDQDPFLVVAGKVKSGKSRSLLEALVRVAPLHLVLPVRRKPGIDVVQQLLALLRSAPPDEPWIILIDDLHEHLQDMSLGTAVNAAMKFDPRGCIVGTIAAGALTRTDGQMKVEGRALEDQRLLEGNHVVSLPDLATPAEQKRVVAMLSHAGRLAGISADEIPHFTERLSAVPQLRTMIEQAELGLPETSHRLALVIAAAQMAHAHASRRIRLWELRSRARCIHARLPRRDRLAGEPLDSEQSEAIDWATSRISPAYAILMPTDVAPDSVELSDTVLVHLGEVPVNPRFAPCTSDPDEFIGLGDAAYFLNAPTQARSWYQLTITSGHPAHAPIAAYNLGLVEAEAGDPDAARAAYQIAIDSRHPDVSAMAAYNLGHLEAEAGQAAAARAAYQIAITSGHPDQAPKAAFNLGLLEQQAGDPDAARSAYQIAIFSGHPEQRCRAMAYTGRLEHEMGDLESARAAYAAAIALAHPDHSAFAALHLGRLERDSGNFAAAREVLSSLITMGHPNLSLAGACLLGMVEERAGNLDAARDAYRLAIESGHPDHAPTGALSLGVLERRDGHPEVAREAYRYAIDSAHPEVSPMAAMNLGRLEHDAGDADEACTSYELAISLARSLGSTELALHAERALAELEQARHAT